MEDCMSCWRAETMASRFLVLVVMLLASSPLVRAADEDPLQDFCVADEGGIITLNGLTCKPANKVQASDFLSMQLRNPGTLNKAVGVAINVASVANFPGLNTHGLSIARVDFQPKGVVPPHVHPRATEVIYLVQGTLKVGFVSTSPNNTLYQHTLSAGDLFVFPRGLVHFQFNPDTQQPALVLVSQNPGVSPLATALFAASPPLPTEVLETAFGIDPDEVNRLIASVSKTASM